MIVVKKAVKTVKKANDACCTGMDGDSTATCFGSITH